MLRTAIITSNKEIATGLTRLLHACRDIAPPRVIGYEGDHQHLTGMVRTAAPHLIFLDVDSPQPALAVAARLRTQMPEVTIVGVGLGQDENVSIAMEAGFDEYLAYPFESSCVNACLERRLEQLQPRTEHLYAFLPARAGAGASTLAVNAAMAMSAQHGPTLLADLDLNCGIIRFMLHLENPNSVMSAAGHAFEMDDSLWRQIVTPRGKLDILHAGVLDPDSRPQTAQVRELLNYSRRNYKTVCVDLSNSLEQVSLDVIAESKTVFLVCTPDPCSVQLAQEKLQYLRRIGLGEKVQILLNRYSPKAEITPEALEVSLGVPVAGTFSNDSARIPQQAAALASNLLDTRVLDTRVKLANLYQLGSAVSGLDQRVL